MILHGCALLLGLVAFCSGCDVGPTAPEASQPPSARPAASPLAGASMPASKERGPDAGAPDAGAPGDGGRALPSASVGLHAPWRSDVVDVKSHARGIATVTAGRAARHEGFDRVVIELRGDGAPGYHVEHIDRPVRACGSGEVVPLPGDSWLAIRLEPAKAHDEQGRVTAVPPVARGLGVVLQIARTCDHEGQVEWVLALKAPNRYRADILEAPLRLVVDVAH